MFSTQTDAGSPGSVRHLVRVVVESNDGFSLLNAGQDDHQSGVGHHQVQVVSGQVKVHRLPKNTSRFHSASAELLNSDKPENQHLQYQKKPGRRQWCSAAHTRGPGGGDGKQLISYSLYI